ncbi:DUF3558 family protein [Amycolatopsis magusensis]|uniref:DUF3558 family protein n=1 Tax=Amycolatopsis magusensis TaxID=882444 RepID=UPI0037BBE0E8
MFTLAAVALVAGGCSTEVPGEPVPQPATATLPPTRAAPAVFDDVEECSVLDQALIGQEFPASRKEKTLGGYRGCVTDKPGFGRVNLSLDEKGVDDIAAHSKDLFDGTYNGRRLVMDKTQIGGGQGDCAIFIDVNSGARVRVGVVLSAGSTDEACVFIEEVMEAVEAHVPRPGE